ncbi:MAG: FecR family protein [Flavobacterium sp.]|nr:FecR family protein [Flavobacterium sp.]
MEDNYKLAKWLAGELSEAELRTFEKSPEFKTYEKIAHYSSQLAPPSFDENSLYQNVISGRKKTTRVVSLHQTWWFRVAAVFLIFLGLTYFYTTSIAITESAENGEFNVFNLPDDSQVVLNAGSEIDYNKWNWDNHRQLQLSGEAYFKVAKGKKFEVQTNLGTVTVLGTQFNVKARKNRFDVTCYEGRVKVNYDKQQLVITKGQRVSFKDGILLESPNTIVLKPEWTSQELAFVNENLSAILEEMERQYDCTFVYADINNSQLFTGTIPANNVDQALQVLATVYHLKFKKTSNNTITLEFIDVEK